MDVLTPTSHSRCDNLLDPTSCRSRGSGAVVSNRLCGGLKFQQDKTSSGQPRVVLYLACWAAKMLSNWARQAGAAININFIVEFDGRSLRRRLVRRAELVENSRPSGRFRTAMAHQFERRHPKDGLRGGIPRFDPPRQTSCALQVSSASRILRGPSPRPAES